MRSKPGFFGDLMDDAQQIRQIGTVRDVLAVAIHDLPQQRDFLDALPRQAAHVRDDFADAAAALDAAPERDNAERAGVRAAVDNRDVRADQAALLVRGQDQIAVLDAVALFALVRFQLDDLGFALPRCAGNRPSASARTAA